jgi:uncharacterized protein (DUF58 family)
MAVAGVVLAVVGWVGVWPPLAILGIGFVVLVVGAVLVRLRPPAIAIERQIEPSRVAKGSTAIALLQLHNRGTRTAAATIGTQQFGADVVPAILPRLRPGERAVRACRLPTTRRGIFELGPIEITRADPFELVRSTQRQAEREQMWITPRVVALKPLATGVTQHIEGPSSDTAPQGSITFHRLREYVPGDELRLIHWKATAHTGELMVRHNVDTSQPFTVVLTDLRPERYSAETFEIALDVAASTIVGAATGQSPVQLRTTAGAVVGGGRSRDPHELLDHLTAVSASAVGTLEQSLTALRRERGGTALIVVTGALEPAELPSVATLRNKFQRIVVVSVVETPAPSPVFSGLSIITTTDLDEFAALWNLAGAS